VKHLLSALLLLAIAACHGDSITLETQFWHSETCHPEIWYKYSPETPPPNANPACEWKRVYPSGDGYTIKR
jgi:hypothetical protein